MEWRRIRPTDYGVLGVFVLVLIGVSVGWYGVSWLSLIGWGTGFGAVAFVFALAAVVVVCLKAFSAPGASLAQWKSDGLIVLVLGVLVMVMSVLGLAVRTEDWQGAPVQAGGIVTLIAGLLLAGCGGLARWAGGLAPAMYKSLAPGANYGGPYAEQGWAQHPQQPPAQWQQPQYAPPQAPQWSQPGYAPQPPGSAPPSRSEGGVLDIALGNLGDGPRPGAPQVSFCTKCGASLTADQAFCAKCGNRRA